MSTGADSSNLDFLKEKLTDAEIKVAMQLVAGFTRKQIAEHTGGSVRTIENTIFRIRRILHVENGPSFIVRLFLYLVHNGFIDPAPYGLLVDSDSK
jgi:DNA-binding CsgD family transcriptional regulator